MAAREERELVFVVPNVLARAHEHVSVQEHVQPDGTLVRTISFGIPNDRIEGELLMADNEYKPEADIYRRLPDGRLELLAARNVPMTRVRAVELGLLKEQASGPSELKAAVAITEQDRANALDAVLADKAREFAQKRVEAEAAPAPAPIIVETDVPVLAPQRLHRTAGEFDSTAPEAETLKVSGEQTEPGTSPEGTPAPPPENTADRKRK